MENTTGFVKDRSDELAIAELLSSEIYSLDYSKLKENEPFRAKYQLVSYIYPVSVSLSHNLNEIFIGSNRFSMLPVSRRRKFYTMRNG